MAITPDPGGEFLKAFQVADTSNRDYQRIEMQRQAMAEAAVQRARENKANDFKLMLSALGRQDDNAYRQKQLEQQDFQNQTSRYGAQTSRYGQIIDRYQALNPRTSSRYGSGDPLGLGGGGYTAPTTPLGPSGSIPEIPAIPDGPATPYPDAGDGADGQLFGAGNPAIANPAYGAVSPEDGAMLPAPSAAPSAPLIGEPAPVAAAPPDLSSEPLTAPPVAPTDNTPVPGAVIAPPAAAPDMPVVPDQTTVPQVNAAPEAPLLPPPVLSVPAIGGTDLVSPLRNEMFQLQKASQQYARTEIQQAQEANKILSALPRVAPELRDTYLRKLDQINQGAVDASGMAQEAKTKAEQIAKQSEAVQKRQDALGAITGLEGVLPPAEQAQLLKEAADPTTGGQTDRKIVTLAQYDAVRQQYGLTHQSRGFQTAQEVARVGQSLASKDAMEDRRAAEQALTFRRLIEENKTKPAEEQADAKTVEEWQKQVNSNAAGERLWKEREMKLANAVQNDMVPAPPTIEPAAATPMAAPAAPVTTAPGAPAGLGFMKSADVKEGEVAQMEANKFWTEGKQQAAKLGRISQMTDSEVEAVANGDRPVFVGMGGGVAGDAPPYYKALAKEFEGSFQMPAGGDKEKNRGRSDAITPADFLREAAKEELARRRSGGKPVTFTPEVTSKIDKAAKKYGIE